VEELQDALGDVQTGVGESIRIGEEVISGHKGIESKTK
jgi:hypothetical protein